MRLRKKLAYFANLLPPLELPLPFFISLDALGGASASAAASDATIAAGSADGTEGALRFLPPATTEIDDDARSVASTSLAATDDAANAEARAAEGPGSARAEAIGAAQVSDDDAATAEGNVSTASSSSGQSLRMESSV